MADVPYWQLLRDPRWQRKRLDVMNAANFSCECCGDSDRTLNVHHKLYRKGAKPWEYENTDLACLCEECHGKSHQVRIDLQQAISQLEISSVDMVLGYALAWQLFEDIEKRIKVDNGETVQGLADGLGLSTEEVIGLTKDGFLYGVEVFSYKEKKHAKQNPS